MNTRYAPPVPDCDRRPARSNTTAGVGLIFVALCLTPGAASASESAGSSADPFRLAPHSGLEFTWPAQEGHRYAIEASTDLGVWTPVGTELVATGRVANALFPARPAPQSFFRVSDLGPDRNYLVGLEEMFLGAAKVQFGDGNWLLVRGLRVRSREYGPDDYLVAVFSFDLARQHLLPTALEVYPRVGVVCGDFFLRDVPAEPVVMDGQRLLQSSVANNLTISGQELTVDLEVGQLLRWATWAVADDYEASVFDPQQRLLTRYTVSRGQAFEHAPLPAFLEGRYRIQLRPVGAKPVPLQLSFNNANGGTLARVQNGFDLALTLPGFPMGYRKLLIDLRAGQTLRLAAPGSGAHLTVYGPRGVPGHSVWGGRTDINELIYTATQTGPHYVILHQTDYGSHAYRSLVSVTD